MLGIWPAGPLVRIVLVMPFESVACEQTLSIDILQSLSFSGICSPLSPGTPTSAVEGEARALGASSVFPFILLLASPAFLLSRNLRQHAVGS